MPGAIAVLLLSLAIVAASFSYRWWRALRAEPHAVARPTPLHLAIGFVTNFFDTLGISSFATTTVAFRMKRLVADECLPGTLNVGHAVPTITQALIFIAAVTVSPLLLVSMILAAVAGSWLGAGVVVRLARRPIQIGMGIALVVAAAMFALVNLDLLPGGGDAMSLSGFRFAIAVAVNFALGALMPLGVGLFAPCMITLAVLGMNPLAAYPIMMGSCAFLMPAASLRFMKEARYSIPAALGLSFAGVPAVLVAAYLVKSLPLGVMRWVVVAVVMYAATGMLRAARARAA